MPWHVSLAEPLPRPLPTPALDSSTEPSPSTRRRHRSKPSLAESEQSPTRPCPSVLAPRPLTVDTEKFSRSPYVFTAHKDTRSEALEDKSWTPTGFSRNRSGYLRYVDPVTRGSACDCAEHEEELPGNVAPSPDTITPSAESPPTTGTPANRLTQHRSGNHPSARHQPPASINGHNPSPSLPTMPSGPNCHPSHRAKSPLAGWQTVSCAGAFALQSRGRRAPFPKSRAASPVLFETSRKPPICRAFRSGAVGPLRRVKGPFRRVPRTRRNVPWRSAPAGDPSGVRAPRSAGTSSSAGGCAARARARRCPVTSCVRWSP